MALAGEERHFALVKPISRLPKSKVGDVEFYGDPPLSYLVEDVD